jgi:hypothetical protein
MGTTARIILLALAVGLASGAKAEPDMRSANSRLPGCKAFVDGRSDDPIGQGYCAGLVEGIALWVGSSGLAYACAHIPAGVTSGQTVQVVVRYMEQRPNRLHEPFAVLAAQALADAWPCRDVKLGPKR